ncbi:hypothetical protein LENED_006694 [Lentinula edodes]|uniref:Uncharacterized protein n=1 Tax=Lentinula edodes TaxID=5353 RepID=A0A1Q3ECD9_LENED|nr:hypothetical protein LENED_006694 [Lentinula edodes]
MAPWTRLFEFAFVCAILAQLTVASPVSGSSHQKLVRDSDSDGDGLCITCLGRIIDHDGEKNHIGPLGLP